MGHPSDRSERRDRRSVEDDARLRLPRKPRPARRPPEGFAEALAAAFDAIGFEVVELRIRGTNIEALADVAVGDQPITLDDCRRLTRTLHEALVSLGADPEEFDVAVASPGLDRKLRPGRDAERFTGREATLALKEKRDGQRNFRGTILGGDAERVRLRPSGGKPEASVDVDVAWSEVAELRLIPDIRPRKR